MCLPASCETCSKITWKGCGRHIEAVQKQVEPANWCTCADEDRKPGAILDAIANG